jgi:teichuronic acid biosynthesis protein TuaE
MIENKAHPILRHFDAALLFRMLAAGLLLLVLFLFNPIYALVGALVFAAAVFGFMYPETLAWLGLLSVAISPQYLITMQPLGIEMSSVHKLVILVFLIPYLIKYRFRTLWNPIIAAYVFVLVLTFTVSSPPDILGKAQPFKSFLGLTLGWFIYNLNLKHKLADKYILTIALLPIISVAAGVVFHVLGIRLLYLYDFTGAFRLQGANIAPHLAMLGFMGVATAMGEVARGRNKLLWIGLINFAILVATGTRGATIGALLLFMPYGLHHLKRLLAGKIARYLLLLVAAAGLVVIVALPNFVTRFQGNIYEQGLNTSGRLTAWSFFIDEGSINPLFGRGMGAGTVLNQGQVNSAFRVPHNEYIRMYVDGGLVGLSVVLLGFLLVFYKHIKVSRSKNRLFIIFFIFGFMVYSFFDNTLSTTQFSIPLGWYLAFIYLRDKELRINSYGHIENNKVEYEQHKQE